MPPKGKKAIQTKNTPKKKKNVQRVANRNMAPVASSIQIKSVQPKINGGKRFTVSHTEFVMPLILKEGQVTTNLQQLARLRMNPGSSQTFNWLASIATNFEFYRFKKLKFIFKTRSPTSTAASLLLSPDYDASDANIALGQEKQIFNNIGTTDDVVWKDQELIIKPNLMNRLFSAHSVMSDQRFQNTSQDKKTLDVGQLSVYVDGYFTNTQIPFGKLLVEYEVEFWAPQNDTESPNAGGSQVYITGPADPSSVKPWNKTLIPSSQIDVASGSILEPVNTFKDLISGDKTGVVGRFVRDFQGILETRVSGDNVDTNMNIFTSKANGMNTNAGDPTTDKPLQVYPGSSAYRTPSGGSAIRQNLVNALAGDLLKVASPGATSINELSSLFGGFSSPQIII